MLKDLVGLEEDFSGGDWSPVDEWDTRSWRLRRSLQYVSKTLLKELLHENGLLSGKRTAAVTLERLFLRIYDKVSVHLIAKGDPVKGHLRISSCRRRCCDRLKILPQKVHGGTWSLGLPGAIRKGMEMMLEYP